MGSPPSEPERNPDETRWLLVRWGEQSTVAEIDQGRARSQGPTEGHEWFTNGCHGES